MGALFFSPCCVYGCEVDVENDAPDCMSFSVTAALTGVPIDTQFAVANAGVIDMPGMGDQVTTHPCVHTAWL